MFFYADYIPATDTRRVLSYDAQKHGVPRVVSPNMTFLYRGSLCTRRVYNSETTPARYFGVDRVEDVFIPWSDVKGERWPGEY